MLLNSICLMFYLIVKTTLMELKSKAKNSVVPILFFVCKTKDYRYIANQIDNSFIEIYLA